MKITLDSVTNIAVDRVSSEWSKVTLPYDVSSYSGYDVSFGTLTMTILENNSLKLTSTLMSGIYEVRGSISGYRLIKNPWDEAQCSGRDYYFKNEYNPNTGLQKLFNSKKTIHLFLKSSN